VTSLVTIQVRERGSTPRGMKKAVNAAQKEAWADVAWRFHEQYRDKRFTPEHALEAGYLKRKGELIPRNTKAFRQSYTGRKLRIHKHTNPLMFSGDTKKAMKWASVSSTSKGGKAAYSGARAFNFLPPRSRIRMGDEFRRILPREAMELGRYFDERLDLHLKKLDQR
jgi:hypothetical protein